MSYFVNRWRPKVLLEALCAQAACAPDRPTREAIKHLVELLHLHVLNDPSVNGDVVFICAEGDQAGEIWGYRFKEGQMVKLASTIRLRETRN
ncbi:Uncharacterised protein [Mycobacteroides abscessus]|nr:Uncharacterised protein [Mycobacteroides abscessus]